MASASNVEPILQRIKAVEVDGSQRSARVVGDGVLARNVEVVMEKIGGRVNRSCGCMHLTVAIFLWFRRAGRLQSSRDLSCCRQFLNLFVNVIRNMRLQILPNTQCLPSGYS